MAKSSSIVLFLLVLLFVGGLQLCFCKNSTFGCIKREREALLQLKQSFNDPSNRLVSWTGNDCCQWNGVSCNQITGRVVKLDLRAPAGSQEEWAENPFYVDPYKELFATEVNSCLVELKRLEYLDLSGNYFSQSPIPEFFGSLKHLKYLYLSRTGFGGRIPAQLGNLTSLQILDLSDEHDSGLYADDFQWVLGLSSLKHLEMSYVDLNKALDVMQVFNTVPSLIYLGLNYCGIRNIHFSRGSLNSTFLKSVQFLSLNNNGLTGPIPNAIQNMTSLRELDLSYQENYYYNGGLYVDNLQWFSRGSSLQHLDMSGANLIKALDVMQVLSKLPSLVYLGLNYCGIRNIHFPRSSLNSTFLRSVQFLSLSHNGLTGPIPNAIQNMSSFRELDLSFQENYNYNGGLYVDNLQWFSRLSSLQHLDMSGANLIKALDVMQVLNKLPSLIYLGLHGCGIRNIHFPRGSLNSTFLKSVQLLSLSNNGLTGPIPNALQNMTALRELDLSYQDGGLYFDTVQWGSRLSSLQHLDMSGTNLSKAIDVMRVFNTLPALLKLSLSGCGIQNSHFPRGIINSTFFARIQFLDLDNNELRGPIPDALHNMTAVRVLGLSHNYFNSTIPLSLVNSKSLVDLNLGSNKFENIEGGMLSILNKACSLRSLDLSGNSFLGDVLGSNKNSSRCLVYHLEYLSLTSGGISGDLPDYLGQLKGLKELNLAGNSFSGPIPSSLGELSALRSLHLENNQLNGTIPQSLGRLSTLESLYLKNNALKGIIPQSLGRLSALKVLDLSNNALKGIIPQSLGRLSALQELILSNNTLEGIIPQSLGSLSSLNSLYLSRNRLNGTIPKSLGRLSNLEYLSLSHNLLTGSIPDSLGQLGNLWALHVSSNSLQGIVSELNFANLSCLRSLDVGSNNLSFIVKSDWIPPFSDLHYVNMSSCDIGSQFPRWIQTQKAVEILDFSNTNISGGFPIQHHYMNLYYLDLSTNKISGKLPMNIADKMPRLSTLRLPNNLMNGQLPDSLCKLDTLEVMDLSENRLSGEMPHCWRASQRIYLINLSSNKLSGTIPNSVGCLSFLKRLHIDKNNLTGVLPLALRNCKELEILDLGENKFSGSIPTWIGESLSSLRVLRLRNNMLSGSIPSQLCQLGELQILSLAYNNLRGRIPHCFGNLTGMIMEKFPSPISKQAMTSSRLEPTANPPEPQDEDTSWSREKIREVIKGIYLEYTKMQLQLLEFMDLSSNKLDGVIPEDLCRLSGLRGLNLSHNQFSGNIPNRIGELKLLESLDLSNNSLSGSIPSSMSALLYISHLNLSHNKLSGKIPTSNQLQTLDDPSIYVANLQLCGYPLPKCHDDSVQPPTSTAHKDKDHEDDKKEKILFYFVVFVGYATGLWGVIGTLVLKRNWRLAYFRFVGNTKDRIIVAVAVEVARLKQRMQRTNTKE